MVNLPATKSNRDSISSLGPENQEDKHTGNPEMPETQPETSEIPSLNSQIPVDGTQPQAETISTLHSEEKPEQIKDKTKQTKATRHLSETTDRLTQEADEEEENFIEGVEKHHGHL